MLPSVHVQDLRNNLVPSVAASAGDDFMNSFHMDSQRQSDILNSGRSKAIEVETMPRSGKKWQKMLLKPV